MPNVVDVTSLGSAGFQITGASQYASLGHSVAIAGDINGDGFDDIIVGAPYGNDWSKGDSYVVFGHAGGFNTVETASLDPSTGFAIHGGASDYSATSVAGAGDINGDGFDDLLIGGNIGYYNPSSSDTYVVYGHGGSFGTIDLGNLPASDGFKIEDTTNFGYGNAHLVSSAGDVNGDGVGDIIIASSSGADYVVFGSTSGFGAIDLSHLQASSGFAIENTVSSMLGYPVSGAGDVNGDGFADLVVCGRSGSMAAAYVVYGHGGAFGSVDVANLTSSQGFKITTSNGHSTGTVASAGDFNGDGFADLIVGLQFGATEADPGNAYIVFGQADGRTVNLDNLGTSSGIVLNGVSAYDYTGASVSGAGDINGDGFDDVVVGAPGTNSGAGAVYVIYGRASGSAKVDLGTLPAAEGFIVQGSAGDSLGSSVSAGGDVNGDGYADVLIGAPRDDSAAETAGAAYLILGGATPVPHITGTDAGETLTGTNASEYIDGLGGNDVIIGLGGNDLLHGGSGNDRLDAGAGIDKMYGGAGDDFYIVRDSTDYVIEKSGEGTDRVVSYVNHHLRANVENLALGGNHDIWGYGNELDNQLIGNGGNNKLFGLAGNDVLNGKAGADLMSGGDGDDRYFVDNYGDRVIENVGGGSDRVIASANFKLGANIEKLTLTGTADIWAYANATDNVVTGNAGANKLFGMGGNDTLSGGAGNDWLEGGGGPDWMSGGAGADSFVFRDGDFGGATRSTSDDVRDFSHGDGDVLRLNFVDADATTAGNQAFAFIGTAAFDSHAGELRYEEVSGNTYVAGDTNGDGSPDFMIRLDGLHALTSADFIL